MTVENLAPMRAELVANVLGALTTRPFHEFALEARAEGESLQDAVERYEVDYAWQVLASQRMCDATVSVLEQALGRPVSEPVKALVDVVLKAAAAEQAPDVLMSFDNDVPAHLGDLLQSRLAA